MNRLGKYVLKIILILSVAAVTFALSMHFVSAPGTYSYFSSQTRSDNNTFTMGEWPSTTDAALLMMADGITGAGIDIDDDSTTGTGIDIDDDSTTGTGIDIDDDSTTGTGINIDDDSTTGTGIDIGDDSTIEASIVTE